jgi:hypothetical protein
MDSSKGTCHSGRNACTPGHGRVTYSSLRLFIFVVHFRSSLATIQAVVYQASGSTKSVYLHAFAVISRID